ncbi:MAG: NADH-quinone oxidoreductase subunit M [Verrucomicrobiales bacterium]|nr:NADH-quinone oxidoreductase subunit M [Verrucomicrobiales bacterium]
MTIIEFIITIPLVIALAIGCGGSGRGLALFAAWANLLLGAIVFAVVLARGGGDMHFQSSHILLDSPEITLGFAADGMSAILVLLTVIVTFCAVRISPQQPGKGSGRLYYVSLMLIAAGALGAFCATDLFFLYAFHELALIPTFLMIGIYGHGREKVATAWKITIYLGVGSLILLGGLIALYVQLSPAGGLTFDISKLAPGPGDHPLSAETQKWIFLPLLIGFGILVSLFPFHSWAAPAYACAPAPVAMLHAGVLKKFGLYGILRVAMPLLPEGFDAWKELLLILLLGNIIYVGFVTISQRYLDRMLGHSSVMHMGYIFLGIACCNSIGWGGAVLMMFAHGISIALLFSLCGSLRARLDTLEFTRLGGLGANMPFLAVTFGFAAFASIGLPGFANFASEITIFFAAFRGAGELGSLQVVTIVALWGVVISAVYMLRAYRRIFQGECIGNLGAADLEREARLPVVLMIVILLITGLFPNIILKLVPDLVGTL